MKNPSKGDHGQQPPTPATLIPQRKQLGGTPGKQESIPTPFCQPGKGKRGY